MITEKIKRVLLPSANRFIYWLFFCIALLINIEDGTAWYGWLVNPPLLGWFAVGLKTFFIYQSPLEFRYRLGRGLDFLVGILVALVLIAIVAS